MTAKSKSNPAKKRSKQSPRAKSSKKHVVAYVVVGALVLLAGWAVGRMSRTKDDPYRKVEAIPDTVHPALTDAQVEPLAPLVASWWRGETPAAPDVPARLKAPALMVHVTARAEGRRVGAHSKREGTALQALEASVKALAESLGDVRAEVGLLDVEIARNFRVYDPDVERRALLAKIHVGRRGLEVRREGANLDLTPGQSIAQNRNFSAAMVDHIRAGDLAKEEVFRQSTFRTYEVDHFLVHLGEDADTPPRAVRLERGNRYVPPEDVTQKNVRRLTDLAGTWLTNALHDDGRVTYQFHPGKLAEVPKDNNAIRQWMATVALVRLAKARSDDALMARVALNIDYNLEVFYREEGDHGLIERDGKVKLGAVALAALAIVEHPERARWKDQEQALRRTVYALHNDDGSFKTFYKPAERNDNQNFYPGEALLLWATLYEQEKDPELLARFMSAFEYYRRFHLVESERRPAFVPWHTQADYKVWAITKNEELAKFIFEMSDWIVEYQQWDGPKVLYPELKGRFYDPDRHGLGVPHASSTGVYLEGLIHAYHLAGALGDDTRKERYRLSIARGLRSIMQLQFADEIDTYYVPPDILPQVLGGIRTTVYDSRIRCDNVQHNLMALLEIEKTFGPNDYEAR